MTGHMRAGAAPEAREVRAAVDPPAHQLQVSGVTRRNAVSTQSCCSDTVMRHRKWSFGSGEALERGGRLRCHHDLPFVHLRTASQSPTSPPSLFQDAERPDKCSECALPALYIQQSDSRHVQTHPFPPLPLCMLLLLSYTRSWVAAKGHLFGGDTVSPK